MPRTQQHCNTLQHTETHCNTLQSLAADKVPVHMPAYRMQLPLLLQVSFAKYRLFYMALLQKRSIFFCMQLPRDSDPDGMPQMVSIFKSLLITKFTVENHYGVAAISRLLLIIGLFCKRAI